MITFAQLLSPQSSLREHYALLAVTIAPKKAPKNTKSSDKRGKIKFNSEVDRTSCIIILLLKSGYNKMWIGIKVEKGSWE